MIGDLSLLPILQLESKHVPVTGSGSRVQTLLCLADKVGYRFGRIGANHGLDAAGEFERVRHMAIGQYQRPIKVVVSNDGRFWCDNTHWALAAVVRAGHHVTLGVVSHYLIVMNGDSVEVIGAPSSLRGDDFLLAVENARRIDYRLQQGWRPRSLSYTMSDLFFEGGYDRIVL